MLPQRDIGDANHFAAVHVDDLLVQQVPHHAQHVLVRMVGGEQFVFKVDAVETDRPDLVVAHRQPGVAAPQQVAIDARRMNDGDDGRVFDDAKTAAL